VRPGGAPDSSASTTTEVGADGSHTTSSSA
jgi:hypothetical protein